MDVETLVRLLEEHLADIRQSMEVSPWRAFVQALAQMTANVVPKRHALDTWADKVCELLMGYGYTKGLLQGLRFQAGMHFRSAPMPASCPNDSDPPDFRIVFRPADEYVLVTRIRAIVQKAQVLA